MSVVSSTDLPIPQLFAVSIAGARLYVGTLGGLAVFDGAHWEVVPSERALYAVHADERGRVVVGGPDALAELRVDADGSRRLV